MKYFQQIFLLFLSLNLYAQESADKYLFEGNRYYEAKNYKAALESFNKAIKAEPDRIDLYNMRGDTQFQLLEFENAIEDYTKVLLKKPEYYYTYINRGKCRARLNNLEGAMIDFNSAIKLDSIQTDGYVQRGQIYFAQKNYPAAITDYSKVLTIKPNYIFVYHLRSETYHRADSLESAMHDLETILTLDPDDAGAKINVGFLYIVLEEFAKAEIAYKEMLAEHENEPFALNNYGFVLHKLGKTEEGIANINKSLKILPANSYCYKHLAIIYFDKAENKKGCKAIDKGLKLGFTEKYGNDLIDLQNEKCK